jgi:hypothetical protein
VRIFFRNRNRSAVPNESVQVWQTNFSTQVTLPAARQCKSCVLRVRYVSYNADEIYPSNNTDGVFYNCADIAIQTSSTARAPAALSSTAIPTPPPASSMADQFSCCAPKQFAAFAVSTGRDPTQDRAQRIYYDAVNRAVRWDRLYLQPSRSYSTISIYSDSSLPEYVFSPESRTCEVYGADAFYPWCFGSVSGMAWVRNSTDADGRVVVTWSNAGAGGDMQWQADGSTCAPLSVSQQGGLLTRFFVTDYSVSATDFAIPTYCNASSPVSLRSCRRRR